MSTFNSPGPRTKGKMFDLGGLSLSRSNYLIDPMDPTDPDRNFRFTLNICRNLVNAPYNHGCPPNAAACMFNATMNKYVSLGEIQNPPSFLPTSNELTLDYSMGAVCTNNNSTDLHYSTKIIFKCKPGRFHSYPKYVAKYGCQYVFHWLVDAACEKPRREASNGTCAISHPDRHGYKFDFSELYNKAMSYDTQDSLGNSYSVNICGALQGEANNAGAVLYNNGSKSVNLGQANSNIIRVNELIYLRYTNGDICSGNVRHSTYIKLLCPAKDSPTNLVFIAQENCTTVFDLYNTISCSHSVSY